MSKQITYNVSPYYDDFDESNDFHQILFKPGNSVQARELTQLQTILRDQIKKFGDHVFQQGSVVIPGNSFFDLNVPSVKLDANYLGTPITVSNLLDKTIVGATSGVKAIVRAVAPVEGSADNTIFLSYIEAGTSGDATFLAGEDIYDSSNTSNRAKIKTTDAFFVGSLAFINPGVYYSNGSFVRVGKQTVILNKYSSTPSVHVLLKINEVVVDSDDDQSLLDLAQGTPNYAAPGADRVKISLTLTTLPLGSAITDNYIELIRLENGILRYHSLTPKYSELEKALARRTYDESGDYLVDGFTPTILEHLKVDKNRGVYLAPTGDNNKFVLKVTSGKAYIKGFEKEIISDTLITMDKARTADHIKLKETSLLTSFGQAIYVTNLVKVPNVSTQQTVTFYNDNDPSEVSASIVGTAKAYALEYKEGSGIYALYIYNATFNTGFTIEDVGGIRFGTGGSATVLQKLSVPNASGTYTVGEVVSFSNRSGVVKYHDVLTSTVYVYKHLYNQDTPDIGDSLTGAVSLVSGVIKEKIVLDGRGSSEAPIINIPISPISSLRDATDVSDIEYRVFKYVQIVTDSSGNGSVVLDSGKIDVINSSTVIASYSAGVVDNSKFSLGASGTTLILTAGPASATVEIQVLVTKQGAQERTKTLTSRVQSGLTLSGTTQKYATFDKADIYKLISVVSSTEGNVTSRFTLDNGQRNYTYDLGRIVLTGTAPTGTLTVSYQYFEHSPTGDYFSIDSYRNSGIASASAVDFLDYVPSYYSTNDTKIYDLKNYLDFRRISGTTGNSLLNNQQIISSVKFYVGRIDAYGLDTSGNIKYLPGIPEEVPSKPFITNDVLVMGYITVPAWTENILDIRLKQENVRRFTMKDINALNDRLSNLENYSTLNALETDATNMEIIDAKTGLTRYKTGILVDNFTNPYVISDFYNSSFSVEYEDGVIKPPKQWVQSDFEFNQSTSSNFSITGDVVTLPYTEVEFIQQPFSTKITNVNPFLVIAWIGDMSLSPSLDSWIEKEELPVIYNTVTNEITVKRIQYVEVPKITNVTVTVPWNSPIPPITPAVSVNTW